MVVPQTTSQLWRHLFKRCNSGQNPCCTHHQCGTKIFTFCLSLWHHCLTAVCACFTVDSEGAPPWSAHLRLCQWCGSVLPTWTITKTVPTVKKQHFQKLICRVKTSVQLTRPRQFPWLESLTITQMLCQVFHIHTGCWARHGNSGLHWIAPSETPKIFPKSLSKCGILSQVSLWYVNSWIWCVEQSFGQQSIGSQPTKCWLFRTFTVSFLG